MEEKSILLSCSRRPESTGTYHGGSSFPKSYDWLPQDLRSRIAGTLQEDGNLSIVEWLKQIRFHCVGDFCDVVELSRDADSVVSEEINRLNLVEEQHLVGVPYPNEVFSDGGCDKHLMQSSSEDGEAHDVSCSESGSRFTLSCRSSEGDDSFEQDSDSFTGFFGLNSYLQEAEELLKDVPDFENREDLFATLPSRPLNRGRSLSAISEGSDEVFLADVTDGDFEADNLETCECIMKKSDVNMIFDDGVNKPVAPKRRKNRDPGYRRTITRSESDKSSATVEGPSYNSSFHDFAKHSCTVDTLEPKGNVQSVSCSCRSLVDIPKAIEMEEQGSIENVPQVRLRPHAAASSSPKTNVSVTRETSYYDNLGFDDSLNEKNPEDLILINRACRSTKLRRHPRNAFVSDEILRLSRNSINDCELTYNTLPMANSDRLYKRNTISEMAVHRSEVALNFAEKSKVDANKLTVALEAGRSLSRLDDNGRNIVSVVVGSGECLPDDNMLKGEIEATDADSKPENIDEFSYETLADEKLEVSSGENKNSGLSDDERILTIDNDGLARPNIVDSGLNESETFVDLKSHNENLEVPIDDDGLSKPNLLDRGENSEVVEKFLEESSKIAFPKEVSSENINRGTRRVDEEKFKNFESSEVDLPIIDSEGLAHFNPLDSGVDATDTEVETVSTGNAKLSEIDEGEESSKLETFSEVAHPPINPGVSSRMNPFDKNVIFKDVEIIPGDNEHNDIWELADVSSNPKGNEHIPKIVIDEEGVSRMNPLDREHESEDVKLLEGNLNSLGKNSESLDLLADKEGVSKVDALEKKHDSEDIKFLEINFKVPGGNAEFIKVQVDREGAYQANVLESNRKFSEVDNQPDSRGSMEVNFSRSPNSIRSIDDSEENDDTAGFNSPADARSTYDNFGSLERLEDPDYDNITPTNATIFAAADNVPLGDDPEQPARTNEKSENPDDSYFDKLERSKTPSEYSDGNKEDRFESLDSERSFHTALDKISPTRSEYENSFEDLEVVDGKTVGASQEDPGFGHGYDSPEQLYVNFPLKGNIENPDMVTSTPNKPVRKHLNATCPGGNSGNAVTRWPQSQAADVPIHKCKTMPDLSVHQRTGLSAHRIQTEVFDSVDDVRRKYRDRKGSTGSDIVAWKNCLWNSLVADEDGVGQWFSSNDAEGKIYFFEENSNESSWVLPTITVGQFSSTRMTSNASPSHQEVEVRNSLASEKARVSKTRSMVLINQSAVSRDIATRKSGSIPRDWPQLFDGNMCVLKEGTLNRTKITENGKKLRKNWSTSHVVLTELFLLFFKDAKTFAAMKTGQSASAKPDISVDLNGALIEPGERASSRKNVYIISTVLGLQVLLQSDNAALATEWYQQVHTAISHLPSGFEAHTKITPAPNKPRDTGSKIFMDTNSPEENKKFPKIGRSRSVKIKRPEGSLEDLSSSAAERQTRIKAKLRKFFQRRPTMDSLVKNGIYKDEPAFGSYLHDVCPAEPPRVPRFVRACIDILENNPENMKADGLYRASGNLSQIQKIRLQVDQNNLDILGQEEDVHVLTGALKLFFRELKEPLIPFAFFEDALNASMFKKKAEKVQCFRDIVKALPPANRDTLQFLLQHLLRVTSYQEHNRMHIPNLAIVFGPTLMWPAEESANMALDLMQQNFVIECLLSEYDKIFK